MNWFYYVRWNKEENVQMSREFMMTIVVEVYMLCSLFNLINCILSGSMLTIPADVKANVRLWVHEFIKLRDEEVCLNCCWTGTYDQRVVRFFNLKTPCSPTIDIKLPVIQQGHYLHSRVFILLLQFILQSGCEQREVRSFKSVLIWGERGENPRDTYCVLYGCRTENWPHKIHVFVFGRYNLAFCITTHTFVCSHTLIVINSTVTNQKSTVVTVEPIETGAPSPGSTVCCVLRCYQKYVVFWIVHWNSRI